MGQGIAVLQVKRYLTVNRNASVADFVPRGPGL
jgi:hypothetical protein